MPTTMQAVLNAVLAGLAPLLAVPPMTLSARNEWVRATSALVVAKSEEQDIETEVIDA
jgi:hypothetical protein